MSQRTLADFWPREPNDEKTQPTTWRDLFTKHEEAVWEQPYIANETHEQLSVGTPVGIRVVQSVVRSATQSSLSFFHVAGMGEVKQGPTVSDTMNHKYNKYNTGMTFTVGKTVSLNKLKKELLGTNFKYFVDSIQDSRFTQSCNSECAWYSVKNITLEAGDSILRFTISYKKLIEFDMTLKELADKCFENSVKWFVSPDFIGMIDLHISSESSTASWISKLETTVCGSNNITAIYFQPLHDANTNDIKVSTVGSDIAAASLSKYITPGSLKSNNVQDIETNYGVEAAAMALREIIDKDPAGIIADFMTRNGMVCSFSKYSVEVRRKGFLTSIGYERPREDITRSITLNNEEHWDEHPSIYSDIMIGTDPEKIDKEV